MAESLDRSRTEYSARNTTVAMAARVAAILAGYFTRVVFTHTLSEDYVGINGLFTDILNVLALSELGVGTAITYALYKPVSEKNVEEQKSLMRMYRQFYRIVAAIVLVGGLLVIPFMDVLIKNQTQVEHLTVIYLMYLMNSVISYLLIYKRTLIDAHQLSYIGVMYQTVFLLIQNAVQVLVLLCTRNFFFFVSVMILCTLANNICISLKADRLYPCLREREVQELPGEEKRSIYRNIRAMLMHKIGNVIVNNTDNLLLSSLVGIVSVSKYSNYFLMIGSVRQVLNQMFQGITASVGNLGVEEGRERIRKIFEASFFMGQWMFGLAAICLFELVDIFVQISFGTQYVFTRDITLVLCLNFYFTGMRQAVLVFRDSMGLFRYDRYKSLAEAAINLGVSILLGRKMGTLGIFLGTLVSTITTSLWVEPYMLYKHRLKISSRGFFLRYIQYACVTFLLWTGEDLLCRYMLGGNDVSGRCSTGMLWQVCCLKLAVCFTVTNLVYLLIYHRTREFRLLVRKAYRILQQKLQRRDGGSAKVCKVDEKEKSDRKKEGLRKENGEAEHCMDGTEFTQEGELLLSLLRGNSVSGVLSAGLHVDWDKLVVMAQRHGVLPLLYDSAAVQGKYAVPEEVQRKTAAAARKTVLQSYRLLFLCKYLIGRLEEACIPVILLKGVGTASYYPTPELRKSGDVDLLLTAPEKLEAACEVLEACGCTIQKKQLTLHHVVFVSEGSITIELHTMMAEPFDNNRMNRYLQSKLSECQAHMVRADVMGVPLPVLAPGYHAYELLIHMLQHFLRAGFGLKLLYDWVMFWNHDVDMSEKEQYLVLVEESGIKGFSDMVTSVCCRYLGLSWEKVQWMKISMEETAMHDFMADVLEAEEFGRSESERMVSLRNGGLSGYVREFQHQMCLNFPKASRCCLCWPVLWCITLSRFLYNNHRIRKVSCQSILKNAGQRGRLIQKMKLWKR